MSRTLCTQIVGVSFDNRQELLAAMAVGDKVFLVKEPTNEYDANAIKIIDSKDRRLGYVPRENARVLVRILKDKTPGVLLSIGAGPTGLLGANVSFDI